MRCTEIGIGVALGLAGLAGCGESTPKAKAVEAPAPAPREGGESYTQSIGALSDHEVNEAFKRLYPEVESCLEKGIENVEGLSGTFTVALRIRPDGGVKWAYLRDSTLGDRTVERCVIEAAARRTWPKPVGGEGEADHTFSAESRVELVEWEERQLTSVMTGIRKTVYPCLQPAPGRYRATVYIGRDGKVLAAGVAPPNPEADAQSDCIAERLGTLQFGRQRKLTKVSFVLR